MVSCFGRTLLPKWKLHFLLNPLLSLVESSLFSIRPLEEWAGQARPGWVLLFGSEDLHQGSRAVPGC